MKRSTVLTAAVLAAAPLVAAEPPAEPSAGIPATVAPTDFVGANAGFRVAADASERAPEPVVRTAGSTSERDDFRTRAPVRENVGLPILDGANRRDAAPKGGAEEPPAESRGVAPRVADQIAERIERAVDERVAALRAKLESERRRWTLKIFFAALGTVVAGTLVAESVKRLTLSLLRAAAAVGRAGAKRLAAIALAKARKIVEQAEPPTAN